MQRQFFPSAARFERPLLDSSSRVAILMRTKDRPILLARAFASVLDQRHQDWCLYLVNDGGDPAPVDALCRSYETAFAGRLHTIHHAESQGMEAASNAALAAAEGDFIVVHDDDDAWHPDFLTQTVQFLTARGNEGYVAVLTNMTVVNERIAGDEVIEMERMAWGYWKPQVDLMHLLSRNGFPPIGLLVRRAALEIVGTFNKHLPVLGDWDFHLRLLLLADIGTIDTPLAYYHHRVQSSAGIYGNSVRSGISKHQIYDTLYRNSSVRQLLQKSPEYTGLLHVLLRAADENAQQQLRILDRNAGWGHDRHVDLRTGVTQLQASVADLRATQASVTDLHALQASVTDLQASIAHLQATVNAALRPLRAVWRLVLPLRIAVAKLRGRR